MTDEDDNWWCYGEPFVKNTDWAHKESVAWRTTEKHWQLFSIVVQWLVMLRRTNSSPDDLSWPKAMLSYCLHHARRFVMVEGNAILLSSPRQTTCHGRRQCCPTVFTTPDDLSWPKTMLPYSLHHARRLVTAEDNAALLSSPRRS